MQGTHSGPNDSGDGVVVAGIVIAAILGIITDLPKVLETAIALKDTLRSATQ